MFVWACSGFLAPGYPVPLLLLDNESGFTSFLTLGSGCGNCGGIPQGQEYGSGNGARFDRKSGNRFGSGSGSGSLASGFWTFLVQLNLTGFTLRQNQLLSLCPCKELTFHTDSTLNKSNIANTVYY